MSEVWYSSYREGFRKCQRLVTPIHYHLRNRDILAAMSELRKGSDPSVKDEMGRTVLDLAIELLAYYLQTALCTSIAVDFLNLNLERKFLFPFQTQFIAHYDKYYEQLYNQPNNMRYYDYQPDANLKEVNKYTPKKFPVASTDTPQASKDNLPEDNVFPLPHENDLSEECSNGVMPDSSKSLQANILLIVKNSLSRPFPQHVLERMSLNLRRIKSHLFLVQSLSRCPALYEMSLDTFHRAYENFSFPYLYTATLKLLFQIYPKNPSREAWNQKAISDASRLANIIVNKKLPGFEILRYLADAAHYYSEFLEFSEFSCKQYASNIRFSYELAQYLMHMAFVLNCPKLFEIVTKVQPRVFQDGDIFDWDDLLYQMTQHQQRFPVFHSILMRLRLKMRIEDTMINNVEPNQRTRNYKESLAVPLEERFLSDKAVDAYVQSFGYNDAKELKNILKDWKYGASRPKKM